MQYVGQICQGLVQLGSCLREGQLLFWGVATVVSAWRAEPVSPQDLQKLVFFS